MSGTPVLRIDLSPSRPFAAALFGAHALAGACAALVLPGAAGGLLALALAALGAAAARRQGLLAASASVRRLELAAGEGEALATRRDGTVARLRPRARRYVSRWLVVLGFRDGPHAPLVVCRGMLAEDQFRRLRLWALWGRLPPAAAVAGAP